MTLTTGMSMVGKMSTIMRERERIPIKRMNRDITAMV
jgi:hypothetical protein